MKIASTITVTTAKVIVSIKDESGCIILEKTFKLAIPEKVSERMEDIKVITNIEKHEYQLGSIVKMVVGPTGTVVGNDYIDQIS